MKRSVLFCGLAFVIVIFLVSTSRAGAPVGMGAPVKVINTKANPVPITGTVSVAMKQVTPLSVLVSPLGSYVVPNNKRFVVEYLSCRFYSPNADYLTCGIKEQSATSLESSWLPASHNAQFQPDAYMGGMIRAYFTGGQAVQVVGPGSLTEAFITGYLEDIE